MAQGSNGRDAIRHHVDSVINKSFLILDQIHESCFPVLEKSIYCCPSVEKIDRTKIAKTEFIIRQRMKHVADNHCQLERLIAKLPDGDPCKVDLINRLRQLQVEQKKMWTLFKAIQSKRVERDRLEREQEESLTRRFTAGADPREEPKNVPTGQLALEIDNDGNDANAKILKPSPGAASPLQNCTNKIRNQKQLAKRVRTTYRNFSTDFFGLTKTVVARHSIIDWLLFLFIIIFLALILLLIVWQTSSKS